MKVIRHPYNKKRVFSLLLIGLLLFPCIGVFAAEELEKTHTFFSTSEKETVDDVFADTIVENGKEYKLDSISYKTINKSILSENVLKKIVESENVTDIQIFAPEQELVEDGIKYTLVEIIPLGEAATHIQTVTAYTDYDYAVTDSSVPRQKKMKVTSNLTGVTHDVICNLVGVSQLDSGTWVSSYIDITFIDYDADRYIWRGKEISKADIPDLSGYESDLLASVGESAETGRITDVYWMTDEYNADGGIQRDARATLQKYVKFYRANYEGTLTETQGAKYRLQYEGVDDRQTQYKYEIKATATYHYEISDAPKTSVMYYVMAGVGILLVIGLIVALLYVLAKKQKEKKEGRE